MPKGRGYRLGFSLVFGSNPPKKYGSKTQFVRQMGINDLLFVRQIC